LVGAWLNQNGQSILYRRFFSCSNIFGLSLWIFSLNASRKNVVGFILYFFSEAINKISFSENLIRLVLVNSFIFSVRTFYTTIQLLMASCKGGNSQQPTPSK